jgi:hypothetical protein
MTSQSLVSVTSVSKFTQSARIMKFRETYSIKGLVVNIQPPDGLFEFFIAFQLVYNFVSSGGEFGQRLKTMKIYFNNKTAQDLSVLSAPQK